MNPAAILLWLQVGTQIAQVISSSFPAGTDPQDVLDKITEAKAAGEKLNAEWAKTKGE